MYQQKYYPDTLINNSIEIDIELIEDGDLFVFVWQIEADHWEATFEPKIMGGYTSGRILEYPFLVDWLLC